MVSFAKRASVQQFAVSRELSGGCHALSDSLCREPSAAGLSRMNDAGLSQWDRVSHLVRAKVCDDVRELGRVGILHVRLDDRHDGLVHGRGRLHGLCRVQLPGRLLEQV